MALKKKVKSSGFYFALAAISLSIALVCYSGVVMKADMIGRILVGSVWLLVGAGWIGRYFSRRNIENADEIPGAN